MQQQLIAARDAGAAVLVISDDLDEVLALGDRVAVMHAGQLTEALPAEAWTREAVGLAMAGAKRREVRHETGETHARPRSCALLLAPHRRHRLHPGSSARLLVLWAGAPLGQTYGLLFKGGFGSVFALSETLTRAIPLILTGLAATVAFKARLFNIGAEGQLYAGALAAVAVGGLHGGTGFDAAARGCCSR